MLFFTALPHLKRIFKIPGCVLCGAEKSQKVQIANNIVASTNAWNCVDCSPIYSMRQTIDNFDDDLCSCLFSIVRHDAGEWHSQPHDTFHYWKVNRIKLLCSSAVKTYHWGVDRNWSEWTVLNRNKLQISRRNIENEWKISIGNAIYLKCIFRSIEEVHHPHNGRSKIEYVFGFIAISLMFINVA